MEQTKKRGFQKIVLLIGGIALFLLPLGISNPYIMYVIDLILIYALLSLGLDLIVGYTGQVSVGHGAFFGIGAYVAAILAKHFGFSLWLTLPVSILASALIGFIIGFIGLKLIEEYLVMATLAFGTIIWLVFLNWTDLTGGPMGIAGITPPPPIQLGTIQFQFLQYQDYYPLLLIFVYIGILITRLIIKSGFGRACTAIRDDELAAQAMGIPVFKTKVFIFTISAAFCGAAGALYAHFLHVVSPETFAFGMSVTILTMVMIGGQGSVAGAIIGAIILTVSSEALRETPELRMLIYGFLIIVMIMFFPKGIMGLLQFLKKRVTRRNRQIEKPTVEKEGFSYEQ